MNRTLQHKAPELHYRRRRQRWSMTARSTVVTAMLSIGLVSAWVSEKPSAVLGLSRWQHQFALNQNKQQLQNPIHMTPMLGTDCVRPQQHNLQDTLELDTLEEMRNFNGDKDKSIQTRRQKNPLRIRNTRTNKPLRVHQQILLANEDEHDDHEQIIAKHAGDKCMIDRTQKDAATLYPALEKLYKSSPCAPDSLMQLMLDIQQQDRITPREEMELGRAIQESIRLQLVRAKLEERESRAPTDEEWCAATGFTNTQAMQQVLDRGLQARNLLVTSNLRLVQSHVNKYIRNGLSSNYNTGDMMQDGMLALIRAAEKFEPDQGWRFSTYAMYWIRSKMKRSQLMQSQIIYLPYHVYQDYALLKRVERELVMTLGRSPTRMELGKNVGMSELRVDRCFNAMQLRVVSYDEESRETLKLKNADDDDYYAGKEGIVTNSIAENYVDLLDIDMNKMCLREDLVQTLHRYLSTNEVRLLLLRYGLEESRDYGAGHKITLTELSNIVGIPKRKLEGRLNKSLKILKQVDSKELNVLRRELM
jgi:RNA polymerase nonessential primary-like sigma factor